MHNQKKTVDDFTEYHKLHIFWLILINEIELDSGRDIFLWDDTFSFLSWVYSYNVANVYRRHTSPNEE